MLSPPFGGSYSISDLGAPAGVPTRFGGLTLKAGTTDKLLLGGAANGSDGALYEVTLARDPQGHISGFVGTATRAADAAYNDGGVIYGPGNVLFLARWPNNELGQTKPGSAITDKIIPLTPLGIESSLASLLFVPPGLPGAGRLKLASYGGGAWYDATVTPDGSGTYDLVGPKEVTTSRLSGGPEGFVYVARGSAQFPKPSLIVSEYGADQVATYAVDSDGDPIVSSRRTMITGLDGAEGAFIDPVTGDYLFSTFGSTNRVIVVKGFSKPPPSARRGQEGERLRRERDREGQGQGQEGLQDAQGRPADPGRHDRRHDQGSRDARDRGEERRDRPGGLLRRHLQDRPVEEVQAHDADAGREAELRGRQGEHRQEEEERAASGATARAASARRASTAPRRSSAPSGSSRTAARRP